MIVESLCKNGDWSNLKGTVHAATLSALLDTADPDVNYNMKDLFGSDSDNEEMSLIAQQLQGSDGVRAPLVGLVLVNQFNQFIWIKVCKCLARPLSAIFLCCGS